MSKKIEYLKNTGTSDEVITYLTENESSINNKLLVWFGRNLQYKFNIGKDNDINNIFYGITIIDTEDKLFDVKTMTDRLYEELSNEELLITPTKIVPMLDALKYVEDWFVSINPNIMNFTIESAYNESRNWHTFIANNANNEGSYTYNIKDKIYDKDVVFTYENYKLVSITNKQDMNVEGNKMGHCVGTAGYYKKLSDNYKILSLRDEYNEPHVTIELDNNKLIQVKGKGNKTPIDKYAFIVALWITNNPLLDIKNCTDLYGFPNEFNINGEIYILDKYEVKETLG